MALIEQKTAVSAISDLLIHQLKGERLPTWNEVYHAIYDLTPVDAVPVVHSYWEHMDSNYYFPVRCHACKHPDEFESKYCPWCGAVMNGKDGNNV